MQNFLVSLERIRRRIRTLFLRAIIESVNDEKGIQLVQISGLADEVLDNVERLQNYGLTSNPPVKSEAFVAFVGADRSNGIVLAIDNRQFRFKTLKPGEVCMYTDEGDYLKFSREKQIELHSGSKVTITAPTIEEISTNHFIKTDSFNLEANSFFVKSTGTQFETPTLKVTGDILDKSSGGGKTMASMRESFDNHTHKENNKDGGYTDKPNEAM